MKDPVSVGSAGSSQPPANMPSTHSWSVSELNIDSMMVRGDHSPSASEQIWMGVHSRPLTHSMAPAGASP